MKKCQLFLTVVQNSYLCNKCVKLHFFTNVNIVARAVGECDNHMSEKMVLYTHVAYKIFSTTENIYIINDENIEFTLRTSA